MREPPLGGWITAEGTEEMESRPWRVDHRQGGTEEPWSPEASGGRIAATIAEVERSKDIFHQNCFEEINDPDVVFQHGSEANNIDPKSLEDHLVIFDDMQSLLSDSLLEDMFCCYSSLP